MGAVYVVYRGLWLFLGDTQLGVMRFIDQIVARAGRLMEPERSRGARWTSLR